MNRPIIGEYTDLRLYVADMLRYRRQQRGFSVLRACRSLRRTSPALVSLVVKGKRRLTLDRVEEFGLLLDLSSVEKAYLGRWVGAGVEQPPQEMAAPRRKKAPLHLLSHWLHVFVKDAFQIAAVRRHPEELYTLLAPMASRQKVAKSLDFLLKGGYLRRNLAGEVVSEADLHSVDEKIPSRSMRAFHKAALKNAARALELYSIEQRHAQTLVLALDRSTYAQMISELEAFGQKLQTLAEQVPEGEVLYQLVVNLSPVGGSFESLS